MQQPEQPSPHARTNAHPPRKSVAPAFTPTTPPAGPSADTLCPTCLRRWLRRQGLTQHALAQITHVHPSTVSRWLAHYTRPQTRARRNLFEALAHLARDLLHDQPNCPIPSPHLQPPLP